MKKRNSIEELLSGISEKLSLEKQYSADETTKCCESFLHNVMLHPDISQLVLELLDTKSIFRMMYTDHILNNHILRILNTLQIQEDQLRCVIYHKKKFPHVRKLEILPCSSTTQNEPIFGELFIQNSHLLYGNTSESYGTSGLEEIVLNETQFPVLENVRILSTKTKHIRLKTPSIRDLYLRASRNLNIDVYPTICILDISDEFSVISRLISCLPNLVEVRITVCDFYQAHIQQQPLKFYQKNLRILHYTSSLNFAPIEIYSLEEMEQLMLYNVECTVLHQVNTSHLRMLEFSRCKHPENTVGLTRFPNLNLFIVKKKFDEVDLHPALSRIYQECIRRNQNEIETYEHGTKFCLYLNSAWFPFFYCNGCHDVVALSTEDNKLEDRQTNVCIHNLQNLSHLYIIGFKNEWYLSPNAHIIHSLFISLDTNTYPIIQQLLTTHQFVEVKISIRDLTVLPFQTNMVPQSKILSMYVNQQCIELYLSNLCCLKSLFITVQDPTQCIKLKLENLPSLKMLILGDYTKICQLQLYLNQVDALSCINIDPEAILDYTVQYGEHPPMHALTQFKQSRTFQKES